MVENGKVNWKKLGKTVRNAVRFLDDVIDANRFPLKQIGEMTRANRKIGLGVMGFADMLIKLGVPYDSDGALKLAEKIMKFVTEEARKKSVELGEERGSFPNFDRSVWKDKYDAMRNATITTIAPTGSISIIASCSSGIEPLFAISFMRKVLEGTRLFEINPLFEMSAKERGFYSAELLEETARTGSVQGIRGVPEDVKRAFVTALDINPEWHVKMQAAFQKYTDNAVSKCLKKGTLVQTNQGLLKVEDCGMAEGNDIFASPLSNLRVSTRNGMKRVMSHYSGGSLEGRKIRLSSGQELVGAKNSHLVSTLKGWRRLKDIKLGDLVRVKRRHEEIHTKGSKEISFKLKIRTNTREIKFPKAMSSKLAKWLGMLVADGSTTLESGCLSLSEKDPLVGQVFDDLSFRIFGIHPKLSIDSKTGVKYHMITSRNLCRWVQNLIGENAYSKHVPSHILQSSSEEKLAFINGLTLDGYCSAKHGLVVYDGVSEILANQVAELLRSFGLPYVYQGKKKYKSTTTYFVNVSNEIQALITPVEPHKNSAIYWKKYLVEIDPKEVQELKLPYNHPAYSNLRWLKQSKRNYCWQTTAQELHLSIKGGVEKVAEVSDTGLIEAYDIEVENEHEYLVSDIVSHNTVNLPNDAGVEDVEKVFWLAYRLKCKGITVYRYGSKPEQVLNIGEIKTEKKKFVSAESEYAGGCPTKTYPFPS
jgi:ribonucleoside-diphosphate reductase alpha chain